MSELTKGKKIFLVFAIIFVTLLLYASYDISRRTTFPGSKPQLKERLGKQIDADSVKADTIKVHRFSSTTLRILLLSNFILVNLKQIKANYRHEKPPLSRT
jgi:hypothetical protein